jgi:hypothetical protein
MPMLNQLEIISPFIPSSTQAPSDDQAQQLRKLMKERVTSLSGLQPINFFSNRLGAGKSLIVSQLAAHLALVRRKRVLVIEEVKNPLGFCGIPRFLGLNPGLREPSQLISNRLVYFPFQGSMTHFSMVHQLNLELSHFDYCFIESEQPISGVPNGVQIYRPFRTPFSEEAFLATYQEHLDVFEGFQHLGVLMNSMETAAAAQKHYRQMNDTIVSQGIRKWDYLGFIPLLKNSFRSLRDQEILLDLEKKGSLSRCLDLTLKQIRQWREQDQTSRADL